MDASGSTEAPGGVDARAAAWLARRDRGGWSDADAAGLEAWLDEATAHRVAFLRMQAAWEECGRLQALGAGLRDGPPERGRWTGGAAAVGTGAQSAAARAPANHADDRAAAPRGPAALETLVFAPRHRRPAGSARMGGWAALAATVVLAAGLALGWQWQSALDASTHSTAVGGIDTVPLADGSRTVLGSDSRIEVRLSRGERRIELHQGEAFFEAAKDPRRPFVVEAGERRVVAVGTRFSVRRDGPDLRVVVTEGSVRLESGPDGGRRRPMATLPAGSVALATATGVMVQSGTVDEAERLVGWQDGLLSFSDVTLAEAAAEFNRWNARPILVADEAAAVLRIGGSFRWSNAEGFVRLLEQGFPVRAEVHDDRIVLHGEQE